VLYIGKKKCILWNFYLKRVGNTISLPRLFFDTTPSTTSSTTSTFFRTCFRGLLGVEGFFAFGIGVAVFLALGTTVFFFFNNALVVPLF
jgi:hypothetical protein